MSKYDDLTPEQQAMVNAIGTGMELFKEAFRVDPHLRDALNPKNFQDFDSMFDTCQTMFAHGFWTAYSNIFGIEVQDFPDEIEPPEVH